MNKPHKTAIARTKPSAPFTKLYEDGRVRGRVLDYGCGRGKDVSTMLGYGLDSYGYDPHYRPERPRGKFDTILCTYVLNVIQPEEQEKVIEDIKSLLYCNGVAYVTVRADKKALNGWTKNDTYQEDVYLQFPIVYDNNGFRTYRVTK